MNLIIEWVSSAANLCGGHSEHGREYAECRGCIHCGSLHSIHITITPYLWAIYQYILSFQFSQSLTERIQQHSPSKGAHKSLITTHMHIHVTYLIDLSWQPEKRITVSLTKVVAESFKLEPPRAWPAAIL